jgi:putative FmdB family regulatory protein
VPTYQYRCTACGESLEAVQSFAEPSLTDCPACGGALRKVFNSVGIVFKGSGFYRTDSRSGPVKAGSDGAKSDSAKSDSPKSDGAKSESAPKSDSGGSKSDSGSTSTASGSATSAGSGGSGATAG